jgi:hypothetical protein
MNVAEIAKLVAEVSDGENSPTISFPKKITVKLVGNYITKLAISSG